MAQGHRPVKNSRPHQWAARYRPPSRGANQRAAAPANEGTARYLNLGVALRKREHQGLHGLWGLGLRLGIRLSVLRTGWLKGRESQHFHQKCSCLGCCQYGHSPPSTHLPEIPPPLPGPKREKTRKIKCTVSVKVLMSVQRLSNLPAGSYLGILGEKPVKQAKPEIPSNS